MRIARVFLPLLPVAWLAACAEPQPVVASAAPPAPPPARAEIVPKPPVSEELLTWRPGHWDWVGNGYVWIEGEYVKRAGTGSAFQPGYWSNQGGAWTWVKPHWVVSGAAEGG